MPPLPRVSLDRLMEEHRRWMDRALEAARAAYDAGEVPVGAVVVRDDTLVARAHNRVEALGDPTAHAETLAVRAACDALGTKFLPDCTLYVTLEPCAMCAGAVVNARVPRLVYGADDPKSGMCGSLEDLVRDGRLNHRARVVSGVRGEEAAALLRRFFRERR